MPELKEEDNLSIEKNVKFQIWEVMDYLEENDWQLTEEQKQELQNAIDDLRFYLD